MSESIMERLRYHAQDMDNTAFSRSTMREAEAEITRLTACLRYEQHRAERIGTHGPHCKNWGPAHYECAMSALTASESRAERLAEALTELTRYNERQRWKGGVEHGTYVPVGDALLKVLNKCAAALRGEVKP